VGNALTSPTSADLEQLEFSAMGQADAAQVAAWKYSGVYFSARVPDFGLIGFVELKPPERGALEIGLGLRPECTDRGLGAEFVRRICLWACDRMTPALLVLRVATFNARAIRVYERVGFQPDGVEILNSYGTDVEFLRMVRSGAS
jgi:RimJ/RimL family protein N-acetyltransferase